MGKYSFILLLFLLSSSVFAQLHSSDVASMQLLVTENGTVSASKFRLERLALEVLMPQPAENQQVSYLTDTKKDEFGNLWMYVDVRNPPHVFSYQEVFLLNVSDQKTTYLPGSYGVPDDVKPYLAPTESIQSDDPDLKAFAEGLVKDSGSDFERVARLASWVYDNVEYVPALKNESKDALWVLENRRGTCDEFATLFVAFARSLGIPARFVAGYYHGSGTWEEHAYAEAYLGSWVPVDPTNLDVGSVDAAHLNFAVEKDNVVGSKIRVYGVDAESMSWSSETHIDVLNYSYGRTLDYDLSLSSDSLFAGDSAVVVLKLSPEEYYLLRADLQACVSDFPFIEVDDSERDLLLEPGRDVFAYWVCDISENLKENVRYSCPLVLNSKRLDLRDIVLNVSTQEERNYYPGFSAQLSDPVIPYGLNQTLFLHVSGVRAGEPVELGVVSSDFMREFTFYSGQDVSFSFSPRRIGEQSLVVYTSTGDVVELSYYVTEAESIYISDVALPPFVLTDSVGQANVSVRGAGVLEDMKLYASSDSFEEVRSFSVSNLSFVSIPFSFNETGPKKIFFRLRGAGLDHSTMREVRVYDVPRVYAESVFYPWKNQLSVFLEVSGDTAKNINISVGEESVFIPELYGRGEYEFEVLESQDPKIVYADLSGKAYAISVKSEIESEGFLEKLARILGELMRFLLALV